MTFSAPLPSKDGKKLFVVGALAQGGADPYEAKSAEFVPFLSESRRTVSASLKMGSGLPMSAFRKEHSGQAKSTAANDSSSATRRSMPSSLAGHAQWQGHCFLWLFTRPEGEIVYGFDRWGKRRAK